jgi:thioredoxin
MEINDDKFEEKVIKKSEKMPVVVDFYADWCGPCHMLAPIMEKVEDEFEGKVVFVKINVDNNPKSSKEYGVTGIPAVKIFKDGAVADEFVGLQPEDMIKKWLKKNL